MKRINTFLCILFFSCTTIFTAKSIGPVNSGKIIFDISYDNSELDEKVKSSLPTESIMYFKDVKVRVEVSMSMGQTIVISDNKAGKGTMLMDMMGNKWAIKMDKEDIKKQKDAEMKSKPTINFTDQTKKIAGYNCTKAIVTVHTTKSDVTFDVWYTKELNAWNSFTSQIDGIDGFLMEFNTVQNGMSMKMSARSVEVMDVDDSKFVVPEGYEYKTMDDLMKNRPGK